MQQLGGHRTQRTPEAPSVSQLYISTPKIPEIAISGNEMVNRLIQTHYEHITGTAHQ